MPPRTEPEPPPGRGPLPGAPATWPCPTCGTANALTRDDCDGCGAAFLAEVRVAGAPSLHLPVVGDLVALPRGQRVALGAAVVLLAMLVPALLALFGG